VPEAPRAAVIADPTLVGATLDLADLGGTATVHLPLAAEGWTMRQKAKGGVSYRYRSSGTVRCRAKLALSRLQMRCRQPSAHLAVPIAGPVGVRLRIGEAAEYCLEFDGQAQGRGAKSATRWQARDAVAPLQCPEISPLFP
jgi:hypothetical protein